MKVAARAKVRLNIKKKKRLLNYKKRRKPK